MQNYESRYSQYGRINSSERFTHYQSIQRHWSLNNSQFNPLTTTVQLRFTTIPMHPTDPSQLYWLIPKVFSKIKIKEYSLILQKENKQVGKKGPFVGSRTWLIFPQARELQVAQDLQRYAPDETISLFTSELSSLKEKDQRRLRKQTLDSCRNFISVLTNEVFLFLNQWAQGNILCLKCW